MTTKQALLAVRREGGFWRDSWRRYKVRVDGAHAGTVGRDEELPLAVPPGIHEVQVKLDWGTSPRLVVQRPDRARIPGLLRDDQNACAFTNSSINDLANLEVPGTAAGTHLADAVSSATMWASSDARAAVEAVQRLTSNPLDRTARDQMVTSERIMGTERATVEGHLKAAEGILGAPLPALVLPVIAVSR